LLRDLGCEDLVDELLADRHAMERSAQHRWDPIAVTLDAAVLAGESPAAEPAIPYWRKPQSLVADGMSLLA
jgi:hypothetical protein